MLVNVSLYNIVVFSINKTKTAIFQFSTDSYFNNYNIKNAVMSKRIQNSIRKKKRESICLY